MIIGIIGGIGSGKSLATEFLHDKYDFTVLQADQIAKDLMIHDPDVKRKLLDSFGAEIYTANGELDKKRYASIIYSNPEKLAISDSIVHPAVWKEIKRRISEAGKTQNMVLESALPGKEFASLCDQVWFIKSDMDIRIRRLMETRGYTEDYAKSIMAKQISDSAFEKYSDKVIHNNKTIDDLEKELGRSL